MDAVGGVSYAEQVEQISDEVRKRLRARGLDPATDPAGARALVAEAVDDVDRGGVPPLADREATTRQIFDAVAGLGPLQRFLDDPSVEEIWINSPGRVFVARAGRSELTTTMLTADAVRDLVERMLKSSGRRVDLSNPFVDATLPGGSRLHVAIPDVTREHWAVNIRKFVVAADGLDDLVALGTLPRSAAAFLDAAVAAGLNIVVSGGTQAGKTTTLGALARAIPARERVITVEEVFELRLDALPDCVAMQTRAANLEGTGEIALRRLITEALRMRPSRLIVGEVRSAEALDLLIALNSGIPGMATVHANGAREAIAKLCVLPLLAGPNISAGFVVPTVAASVDLVVHVASDAQGRRRVREIAAVPGRVEQGVVEIEEIFTWRGGRLVRADGYPPHADRFARAGHDLARLLRGPADAAPDAPADLAVVR